MKKIALAAVGIIVIVLLGWWFLGRTTEVLESTAVTPAEDPLDVTLDFFNTWLLAQQSTPDDGYTSPVLDSPMLSDAMRARLRATPSTETIDQIHCQSTLPPRIGGRVLFTLPEEAQIMILARGLDERAAQQSIVTLRAVSGAWVITDIQCATGETAPVREFSFEREGFLLKNVPPPLNPEFWHLVFEENGVNGHTVPLSFTTESQCVGEEDVATICDPDKFIEPSKVFLQGNMTETGVTVVRIAFD